MEKEFVTYEQSLALKDLGFDEPCFSFYIDVDKFLYTNQKWLNYNLNDKRISSPLYQQAFRWFREKHGLCNFINFSGDGFCSGWEDLGNNEHGFENFKTYEEAEQACLDKLIEICKTK